MTLALQEMGSPPPTRTTLSLPTEILVFPRASTTRPLPTDLGLLPFLVDIVWNPLGPYLGPTLLFLELHLFPLPGRAHSATAALMGTLDNELSFPQEQLGFASAGQQTPLCASNQTAEILHTGSTPMSSAAHRTKSTTVLSRDRLCCHCSLTVQWNIFTYHGLYLCIYLYLIKYYNHR